MLLFAVMSVGSPCRGDGPARAGGIPQRVRHYSGDGHLAWRGELGAALRTGRPLGHVTRGLIAVVSVFLNFAALARLPPVDATAISFAAPVTVALAALVPQGAVQGLSLVRRVVGFGGVLVMLWPYLDGGARCRELDAGTIGAACAVTAAFTNAGATIQTRRLTNSETTASIVFYFWLICTVAGLASLPFAWRPSATEFDCARRDLAWSAACRTFS